MRIFRINSAELVAGGAVVLLGAAGVWEASGYAIGTARAMGPGYIPLVISAMLILCGFGIILVEGTHADAQPIQAPAVRSMLVVLASICAFAFTIDRFGLVPATVITIVVSSSARRGSHLPSTLILAAVVSTLATMVFVWGLALPLEIFTW